MHLSMFTFTHFTLITFECYWKCCNDVEAAPVVSAALCSRWWATLEESGGLVTTIDSLINLQFITSLLSNGGTTHFSMGAESWKRDCSANNDRIRRYQHLPTDNELHLLDKCLSVLVSFSFANQIKVWCLIQSNMIRNRHLVVSLTNINLLPIANYSMYLIECVPHESLFATVRMF